MQTTRRTIAGRGHGRTFQVIAEGLMAGCPQRPSKDPLVCGRAQVPVDRHRRHLRLSLQMPGNGRRPVVKPYRMAV
jgi:hypothetical protein